MRTAPMLRRLITLAVVGVLTGLTGCSAAAPTGTGAPSSTPPAPAGFPVTITTTLGQTVIPAQPQKVVTLIDDEFVVALGVVPVAMSRSPFGSTGMTPVVEEALGSAATPELLDVTAGWPYEKIRLLEPDLILGGVTKQDYDGLAAIAPTLPYEESSTTESWQDRQRTVGRALGKSAEADALVEKVEAEIAETAASLGDAWNGKTFSFAFAFGQGQVSAMRNPDEAAAQLLGELGLVMDDASQALSNPDGSGRVTLNLESLGALAADVVLVAGPADDLVEQVTRNPGFIAAAEARGATVVVLPLDQAMPLVRPSALSASDAAKAVADALRAQA